MKIYFDPTHSLDDALQLAPKWSSMFITRYKNGWTFVSARGIRYVLDSGTQAWMPVSESNTAIYKSLGPSVAEIYVEGVTHE